MSRRAFVTGGASGIGAATARPVAAAVYVAATSGRTGECRTVLPGVAPKPFDFAEVADLPGHPRD